MARTEVVALESGHDGVIFRTAGERFSVDLADERFKGTTWFVPVDKAPPPKVSKKTDPKARPPGAGPLPGSNVPDPDATPGAGPLAGSGQADMV